MWRQHKEAGFTFIELLVVMVVMAVGLVGVFQSTIHNQQEVAAISQRDTAVLLAEKRMAEWLALDDLYAMAPYGDFGQEYPQYRWEAGTEEQGGVVILRLVVLWGEDSEREYTLETARVAAS